MKKNNLKPQKGSFAQRKFLSSNRKNTFLVLLLSLFSQGLFAQTVETAMVDIYGIDVPVPIEVTQVSESVIISELQYQEFVKAEGECKFGFGSLLELTILEGETVDFSEYSLTFYADCSSTTLPMSLSNAGSTFSLSDKGIISASGSAETVVIDLINEFVPITPTNICEDCTNNSIYYGIALSHSTQGLINFISIDPQFPLGSTLSQPEPSAGPASGTIALAIGGNVVSIANLGKSFTLTDVGWKDSEPTIGFLNENLTSCPAYILGFINNGEFYTRPFTTDFTGTYCVNPNQLVHFKKCENNNWNSDPIFDWEGFYGTSISASANAKRALTVHAALKASNDYFLDIHEDFFIGEEDNCSFFELGYSAVGSWGGSTPVAIRTLGASISIVGHEIGHIVNHAFPLYPNWLINEGFADIWGVAIESYFISNLINSGQINESDVGDLNLYEIQLSNGGLERDLKTPAFVPCFAPTSANEHALGRPLGHWFYLLAEGNTGENATPLTCFDNTTESILPSYVCGLGIEAASQIAMAMLKDNSICNAPNSMDQYESCLLPTSINAASNLSDFSTTNYPILNDTEFVIAQIKNAWAAVGVGEADFQVNVPTEIEICEGTPLVLEASSAAGSIIIRNPIEEVVETAIEGAEALFEIPSVTELDEGIYQIEVNYNHSDPSYACSMIYEVNVSVNHIVIDQGESLTICPGEDFELTFTSHNDVDVSTIVWSSDPAGAVLSMNSAGNLQVSNPVAGDYILTGTCFDENGNVFEVSDTISLVFFETPILENTSENIQICSGESVELIVDFADSASYFWNTGETSSSVIVSPTTTPSTYLVDVCSTACETLCTTKTFTVSILPDPVLNLVNICNSVLSIAADSDPFNQYQWYSNSNPGVILGTSSSLEVFDPGDYSLVATDTNGCTVEAQILVESPNQLSLINNCNTTIDVEGNPDDYESFQWKLDGSAISTSNPSSIPISAAGTYSLAATDLNGCETEAEIEITVDDLPILGMEVGSGSGYPYGYYRIPYGTTEVWNSNKRIAAKVIVETGAQLHIKSSDIPGTDSPTIEFLNSASEIHVEKGAILRIEDGATLKGAECNNTNWGGIKVEGNWDAPHPSQTFFVFNESDVLTGENIPEDLAALQHGIVLIHNSTIKDAYTAVHAYDAFDNIDADIGGGIVYAVGSTFENNLTGIQIDRFYGENDEEEETQLSRVINNEFINSASFKGNQDNAHYRHLVLNRSQKIEIVRNNFETLSESVSGLLNRERGAGIVFYSTHTDVGVLDDPTQKNTFTNLFQGIDTYNLKAEGFGIYYNEFENVTKGITLNGAPPVTISGNEFLVPAGSVDDDAFAIFCYKSQGFDISENSISAEIENEYTNGICLVGSADGESIVHDNTFSGPFNGATVFSDNNTAIQLYCNVYQAGSSGLAPKRDWLALSGSSLAVQGYFDDEEESSEDAFSTFWHTDPNTERLHIDNQSDELITLIHDFISAPNLEFCNGPIEPDFALEGVSSFIRNCILDYPEDEGLEDCQVDISRKIREYIKLGKKQEILDLLNCTDRVWTDKLLIGTYIDKRNYDDALVKLDDIPEDTQENMDFKDVSYAYINERTGGSGKQGYSLSNIEHIADDNAAKAQLIAQNSLAILTGTNYVRSIAKSYGNNIRTSVDSATLKISPNPTKGTTTIEFLKSGQQLEVYSLTGIIMYQQKLSEFDKQVELDLSNYPKGIYLVQVLYKDRTKEIAKLVIMQ